MIAESSKLRVVSEEGEIGQFLRQSAQQIKYVFTSDIACKVKIKQVLKAVGKHRT